MRLLVAVACLVAWSGAFAQTYTGPLPPGQGIYSFAPDRSTTTATILSGASITSAIDLKHRTLARIVIPAAWTAANITFQTSYDCSTYNDLYDSTGTEYTVAVGAASRSITIPIADFLGVRCLKIRSGTTGTAVNQGADRILNLVVVN